MLVVELGFPELTTEQIELLCQTAEDAATKIYSIQSFHKEIDRLDISVEAEGTKPVNVTVEINLVLAAKQKMSTQKLWLKKQWLKRIRQLKTF